LARLAPHAALLKQVGAYVMQDDLLNGQLTVEETLHYTAKLRCPPAFSDAQRQARIDQVRGVAWPLRWLLQLQPGAGASVWLLLLLLLLPCERRTPHHTPRCTHHTHTHTM
jgi:hypothetical protein